MIILHLDQILSCIWLCPWEKDPYGNFLAFSFFKEFDYTNAEEIKSEILLLYSSYK